MMVRHRRFAEISHGGFAWPAERGRSSPKTRRRVAEGTEEKGDDECKEEAERSLRSSSGMMSGEYQE